MIVTVHGKCTRKKNAKKTWVNFKPSKRRFQKILTQLRATEKTLGFMANNGFRQLKEPRIGEFANSQRPELVHNEINAWQHILNTIYKEALRETMWIYFLQVFSSPVDTTEIASCLVLSSPPHITNK